VINNACGTQALLNIMMNAKGLELGKVCPCVRVVCVCVYVCVCVRV
jgi:hypothetical protein